MKTALEIEHAEITVRAGKVELAANLALPDRATGLVLFAHGSGSSRPPTTRRRLEIIPGATHLFEEPGALDRVAELARDWFQKYLKAGLARLEAI